MARHVGESQRVAECRPAAGPEAQGRQLACPPDISLQIPEPDDLGATRKMTAAAIESMRRKHTEEKGCAAGAAAGPMQRQPHPRTGRA